MNDARFLTYSLTEPKLSRTVTRYLLKSRSFRIDRKTDYLALAAKIDLLDLALGAGFSDLNFLELSAAPPTMGQATRMKRDPESKAAEAAFNADVDALEQQLKLIENMIVSAGAEYMSKIQAKNSIERLCSRLRNTVRTVEWSGEDVFAGSVGSSAVMQRWVGRGRDGGDREEGGREAKRKWDAVDSVDEVRGLNGVMGAV